MNNKDLVLFLGMLCGDGHLSIHNKKRILKKSTRVYQDYCTGFCNTNLKIIENFANLFYKIFNVRGNFHSRDRLNRKRIYEFVSYSKKVFDEIVALGFPIGVKRDKLRILNMIKKSSAEDKFAFLFGFFITDGYLTKNKIRFHSGSKIFLEEISTLIYELMGERKEVKSYVQKEKYLSYQLTLNKEESRKILQASVA